jgi:hypothetical protein
MSKTPSQETNPQLRAAEAEKQALSAAMFLVFTEDGITTCFLCLRFRRRTISSSIRLQKTEFRDILPVVSRRHKQPDITRKFKNKERKSQTLGVSSPNERRARSQSIGALNQTSLNRLRRLRSKSVRAKVQEMRGAGRSLRPWP